jgi:hypothetical protein
MKRGNVAAVMMQCTVCGGNDDHCKACDGWGKQRITSCPKEIPDAATWRVIQMSEFADKGSFPIAGGVLDQAQSFLDACQICWREEAYWKRVKTT